MSKTRQQFMKDDMEAAASLLVWPGGSAKFQKMILEAEQQLDAPSLDHLAQIISLANTALFVAGNGLDDLYAPWYRDKAMQLLSRAMDVLAVIEAVQERPAVVN